MEGIYERVKKGLADLRRAARMQTDQPAPGIPTDYAVLICHDLPLALRKEPADLYLRATESSPGPKSLKDAGYNMPTQGRELKDAGYVGTVPAPVRGPGSTTSRPPRSRSH